jgi:spore coat-associated protein N
MKRVKVLMGQRRMQVLATLAVLLLAVGVIVASSASFTATAANPNNIFTTGTLAVGDYQSDGVTDNNGTAVVWNSAADMKPGDSRTGTVIIKNDGTVSGTFKLTGSITAGSGVLAAELQCDITQDGTSIYSGPLDSIGSIDLKPGGNASWAAHASHTYNFTVTLPATADDTYQGLTTTARFQWDAVSD